MISFRFGRFVSVENTDFFMSFFSQGGVYWLVRWQLNHEKSRRIYEEILGVAYPWGRNQLLFVQFQERKKCQLTPRALKSSDSVEVIIFQ